MRIIARRERPHPGAQLRITDHEGWRITMFATNTRGPRLADLELRHRLRARAEDRIRGLKDTGMTNLPLQAFAKNEIWLELVQLAAELLTWTQLLAWPGPTSPPEPGNPNAYAYGYWPWPDASSPPADDAYCASPADGPGQT
jgi:hypothetical protein